MFEELRNACRGGGDMFDLIRIHNRYKHLASNIMRQLKHEVGLVHGLERIETRHKTHKQVQFMVLCDEYFS